MLPLTFQATRVRPAGAVSNCLLSVIRSGGVKTVRFPKFLCFFVVLVGFLAYVVPVTHAAGCNSGTLNAAAEPEQDAAGATISGKVSDSSNVALPGAAVTV